MSRNMAPGKWGVLTPLAGGRDGSFFRITPTYVNPSVPPGFSSKGVPLFSSMIMNALTLRHLWASPYMIWLAIAAFVYSLAPYDLDVHGAAAASPISLPFFISRFPLLLTVTITYYSFWHASLYFWDWAARPFVRGRVYLWSKTIHNAALTATGVAVWVACENVMCHLWATGRVGHISDSAAISTPAGAAITLLFLSLMPVWRATHFFVGHRFIHFPAIYSHIHRLHHRNADPDVFAGLAMHPVEQLWFFTGAMPFLWLPMAPFLFFFMGVCFLLSPAGGHSGWEDVMQSDVHHYLHHRFFEVNYASFDASAFDALLGTYMDSFADRTHREPEEDAPVTCAPIKPGLGMLALPDAKSIIDIPSPVVAAYALGVVACFSVWGLACTFKGGVFSPLQAYAIGAVAGFGPIALAYILPSLPSGAKSLGPSLDRLMWCLGAASSALPVMCACAWCLPMPV